MTDRLEVGRISRAHGLRGEVVVSAITNRGERFAIGAVLYDGDVVYSIVSSRMQGDRYVVRFDGVTDRNAAEVLRGRVLTADPVPGDGDEVFVHELIGRRVVDQHERDLGQVLHVEANPAHDIVVCDSGVLIPILFVRDQSADGVRVELPDGLVELYLDPDAPVHDA